MNDNDTMQALHNEIELLRKDVDRLRKEREELSQLILRLLKEKYKINIV